MTLRFTRLLAPFAACVVATLAASCCCQRYDSCGRDSSCEKGSEIPSTYSTTFQRLVVTNKHTRPVRVTPMGWNDSVTPSVPVPLTNTPADIPVGGTQQFDIQVPGTNVDRVELTYLAQDDSNQTENPDSVLVPHGATEVTRCIMTYRPRNDVYTVVDVCPPDCVPVCPPACQPVCR